MKRTPVLFFFFVASLFLSCSDKDDGPYICTSCIASPEALAANDVSGKGIYKGIVVGSSGTITFNIANNDNTVSGVLVLDGETFELHPWPDPASYDNGFSGILSGSRFVDNDLLIEFQVNSTGTVHDVNVVAIPGHSDVEIKTIKEFSTGLVEVFEGTFSGEASGVFNLILVRNTDGNGQWLARSKDTEGFVQLIAGDIQNQKMSGDGTETVVVGTLDNHNVAGTWINTVEDISGTWTGRRTL